MTTWQCFRNRPWLGSWMQRLGALVLDWWEGGSYLGPTEKSYKPKPTPWIFR